MEETKKNSQPSGPVGYEEAEALKIADQICRKMVSKYTFAYYDYDDIYQEAMLMCIEAFRRYDGRVPLENFLSRNLSNRLKSLRRDKYYRPFKCDHCDNGCPKCEKKISNREAKKNILSCVDVSTVRDEDEKNMRVSGDPGIEIDIKEYQDLIDQTFPAEHREDYLKYKAGVPLTAQKRKQIENIIYSIIF